MKRTLAMMTMGLAATGAIADTPRMGGPMKHVMVSFDGAAIHAHADPMVATPLLRDYGETYAAPADVLNATMYNAQYGWMVEGFWAAPEGAVIWIEETQASDGLETYRGMSSFTPIFGSDGSSALLQWNGTMMHNWYAVDVAGEYQATYRVYFGAPTGEPLAEYGAGTVSLNWVAVPTPASVMLVALAGIGATRRRR
jgi:hypothetical protein